MRVEIGRDRRARRSRGRRPCWPACARAGRGTCRRRPGPARRATTWSRPCASDRKASLRSEVHFTGRPIRLRRPEDQQLLGVVEDLRAEAAAHVRRHDAQPVLRHLRGEGAQQQADQVRVLRRGVERVAVVGGVDSGRWRRAARSRWGSRRLLMRSIETTRSAPANCGVGGRGVAEMPVEADVAGRLVPDLRRALGDRVLEMGDAPAAGRSRPRPAAPRRAPAPWSRRSP